MGITCSRELRGLSSPDSTKPQDGKRDCPPFSQSSMLPLDIMVQFPSVLMASFIPVQEKWMKKAIKDADPYTSHSPWYSDGPLLPCHPTFPGAISPGLVAHNQHHLQDTIYLLFLWETVRRGTDGTQHIYTPSPLLFLLAQRMGEREGICPCQGHKPCVASSKVCTFAHSPAYFPKVTMLPANEWYPSASSGLNQASLVRGIQFNGT